VCNSTLILAFLQMVIVERHLSHLQPIQASLPQWVAVELKLADFWSF
jgi:hypothetical protein